MAPRLHLRDQLARAGHIHFHPKLILVQRAGEGRFGRTCSSNPRAPIRRHHHTTKGFFKPQHLVVRDVA